VTNYYFSVSGYRMLTAAEGASLTMYRDQSGFPTIGVGHRLNQSECTSGKIIINGLKVPWADGLTPEECEVLLERDTLGVVAAVNALVLVPITQSQFDALVSFTFNVGASAFRTSTLLKLLNKKNYAAVPDQMRRWIWSVGRVLPDLIERREEEIRCWLSGP